MNSPRRFTVDELRLADPEKLTEWERAWQIEFLTYPETLACWGYSNFRWPAGYWEEDND